MVTQTQVRSASPVLKQIDSIEVLLGKINAASQAGNWTSLSITFADGGGVAQTLDVSALPAANLLNSLFALAQSTETTLNSQLAGI